MSTSGPLKNFTDLLEKKGVAADLDLASFDKLLAGDAELQAAFSALNQTVQSSTSELRTRQQAPLKKPVKVAVTGAAGGIGYATLFRVASGQMLGPDQPIQLNLVELPAAKKALEGVVMELKDCAFPLLTDIVATDDLNKGFDGVDYAMLIGARPRSKGMERADLLTANAAIFKTQGEALNKNANRDTLRVVVVGNPANTNAWIASQCAPDLRPTQFTAMTRLDQDRGLAQLSQKTGVPVAEIERFILWGNHSTTMVPDVNHVLLSGKWAKDTLDQKWLDGDFTKTVQNRGAEIIQARGASSCASAANAAIAHMRDWVLGTHGGWVNMGVYSQGEYGTEEGIYYSFPVTCKNGDYTIIQNVPVDGPTAKKMEVSNKELVGERDAVAPALNIKPASMKETFNKWKAVFEKEGKLPGAFPPKI